MQVIHAKQALTKGGWKSDLQLTKGGDGRLDSVGPFSQTPTHRAAILLPAPLNLHSHSFQRAMAGLTEARGPDPAGLNAILGRATSGPIHMHLAEQLAEVDEVLAHRGARPVEWLLANHEVDARWSLIHCTQMTESETRALAHTGAVAGLYPITESRLGDGIFNCPTYLGARGATGFGSDSNIQIALFEELKTLEYSQRLRDLSRAVLAKPEKSTGRVLFEAAATGGAQAGGRDNGRIEAGTQADLIGLEDDNEWLYNRQGDAALDSLIFGGGSKACIRDVWSVGQHVVKEGRHFRRDEIVRKYRQTMKRLETAI